MKKIKMAIMALMAPLSCFITSCSPLNAGDSFIATTDDGIYRYEVVVSRRNYVRIFPVQNAGAVADTVRIPGTITYEGQTYIVSQIGENAFRNYTNITSVVLPSTISVIEAAAFKNCTSLISINTPQPLSTIGNYAFDSCISLQAFNLNASLSSLGDGCFRDCSSLTQVSFPSSFTVIPNQAFSNCTLLSSIELSATILNIGSDAFSGCTNATSLSLGSSVQSIGGRAFANCNSLQEIRITTAMPPTCLSSTFDSVPENIPVTVPISHVQDYRNATGWNHFTNYIGSY